MQVCRFTRRAAKSSLRLLASSEASERSRQNMLDNLPGYFNDNPFTAYSKMPSREQLRRDWQGLQSVNPWKPTAAMESAATPSALAEPLKQVSRETTFLSGSVLEGEAAAKLAALAAQGRTVLLAPEHEVESLKQKVNVPNVEVWSPIDARKTKEGALADVQALVLSEADLLCSHGYVPHIVDIRKKLVTDAAVLAVGKQSYFARRLLYVFGSGESLPAPTDASNVASLLPRVPSLHFAFTRTERAACNNVAVNAMNHYARYHTQTAESLHALNYLIFASSDERAYELKKLKDYEDSRYIQTLPVTKSTSAEIVLDTVRRMLDGDAHTLIISDDALRREDLRPYLLAASMLSEMSIGIDAPLCGDTDYARFALANEGAHTDNRTGMYLQLVDLEADNPNSRARQLAYGKQHGSIAEVRDLSRGLHNDIIGDLHETA